MGYEFIGSDSPSTPTDSTTVLTSPASSSPSSPRHGFSNSLQPAYEDDEEGMCYYSCGVDNCLVLRVTHLSLLILQRFFRRQHLCQPRPDMDSLILYNLHMKMCYSSRFHILMMCYSSRFHILMKMTNNYKLCRHQCLL